MSEKLVVVGGDDNDETRWTQSGKKRVENHQLSFWGLSLPSLSVILPSL